MAFGTLKFDTLTTSDSVETSTEKSINTSYVFNGVAKQWVQWNPSLSSSHVLDSFNQSGYTDSGAGVSIITFTNNMSNIYYSGCIQCSSLTSPDTGAGAYISALTDATTSQYEACYGYSGNNTGTTWAFNDYTRQNSQIDGDLA